MKKVYKVPEDYIAFLSTVVGAQGSVLNLSVKDIDGNTIIGQEEWESDEYDALKSAYQDKLNDFVLIDYRPKPIDDDLIVLIGNHNLST